MTPSDVKAYGVRVFAGSLVSARVVRDCRMTFGMAAYGNRMATEAKGVGSL